MGVIALCLDLYTTFRLPKFEKGVRAKTLWLLVFNVSNGFYYIDIEVITRL